MQTNQNEALSEGGTAKKNNLKQLLSDPSFIKVPKKGETLRGHVISISRNGIKIDIDGLKTGIVRGPELYHQSSEYANLKVGDEVESTVIDPENENGEIELSFRDAGTKNAWKKLGEALGAGTVLDVKILEANRGGLLVSLGGQRGFLPVSQLNPDHYPRVTGGDKNRILDKLRELIGQTLKVKVIDAQEKEEKLIVSEKAVWDDAKKDLLVKYKVGDIVDGSITALTSFGAFLSFDEVEGLIHISEIAWQRIDHPKDVVAVGDKVRAQIIHIDGAKIFLSMKRLIEDPWTKAGEKYKVGQVVEGKIVKVNPFGLFVELDKDIHGLAHVSELSDAPIEDIHALANAGDIKEFEIISIDPGEHRLGLRFAHLKKRMRPAAHPDPVAEMVPASSDAGNAAA